MGKISLPTGAICACDPLVCLDVTEPFEKSVAPGTYPVRLSIAHIRTDQRVAFAMVQFSEEIAERWQLALFPGQDESKLKEGEIYGYTVDSGTGCFMDKMNVEILSAELDRDSEFYDKLIEGMEKTYVDTWSYINLELSKDCNLIAFSTGFGDGIYGSYFGFGKANKPVCLVTDFVLADPHDERMEENHKETRLWWQFWKR